MPYINIMDKKIYYREYGNGEPVIFLNGVMMSTNSWSPFIETVSKNYRLVVVDLLDQGRTASFDMEYTIDTQAELFKEFLDKLGLENIHLLGISYGGKVAQTFTLNYQDKVKALILSNTDSYTTNIMKEIGKGWDCAASTLNGEMFSRIILPYMYSYDYYEKNYEEMQEKIKVLSKALDREWYNRFHRNLNSALDFNLSQRIREIKVPTLIISSEFDILTPIKYQQIIHNEIEGSKWVMVKDTGHAIMYEKPEEFISIIMEFLKDII